MRSKLFVVLVLCMLLMVSSCRLPTCTFCGYPQSCTVCQRYSATVQWFKDGIIETVLIGFDGCIVVHSNRDRTCDLIVVLSIQAAGFFAVSAAPELFDLNTPPGVFDFYGQSISSSYGTPRVDYYDSSGGWMGSVTASAMSDGWCQAPAPNFLSSYSGVFSASIKQMTPNGYYLVAGTANFVGYGRDSPDMDGDGYSNTIDCDDFDPNVNPGQSPDCTGAYWDQNCNGISDLEECYGGGGGCQYAYCY
ncbi:MAG: hypothetical protein EWM72_02862 [Nitrospira sp.]|nr:MAG: hypothetical protein EWM72_02862 [Nitrospira sp.]